MANDFYLNEEQEETPEEWGLLQQEFHEWQVLNDAADIVASKGLPFVMSSILEIMKQKGIQ
tara:strand:- start:129 stop:311 length:183 start_codon:yes stop_codon:yes gene_type:complete